MNLVRSNADQGDRIDLFIGQTASSKRTAFVGGEALDLVRRLRLIGVDPSSPPEPPSTC
jgi:hypothetical protein